MEEKEGNGVTREEKTGSGRLGAAVQRAMAMRERQTSGDRGVEGIGAMRRKIICDDANFHHDIWVRRCDGDDVDDICVECGGALEMNSGYWAAEDVGTRSMRYARIPSLLSEMDGEENMKVVQKKMVTTERDCVEKQRVCEACRSLRLTFSQPLNGEGMDQIKESKRHRKSKVVRIICRQLLKLQRKSVFFSKE